MINPLNPLPGVKAYETAQDEMVDIAKQIEQLIGAGTLPEAIAVVYTADRYGEDLYGYWRARELPVYWTRSVNLFEIPFARKIILILQYLAAEHDTPYGGDAMLFEILHFDFYQVPPIEIARLTVEVNARKHQGEATSIRKLLHDRVNTPPKTLFDIPVNDALASAGTQIEKLIGAASNLPVHRLLEKMIREAGILAYLMKSPEKPWLLQVLSALIDFARQEQRRDPYLNLQKMVDLIDAMQDNRLNIPLVQHSGSDKGVHLQKLDGTMQPPHEHIFFAGCNAFPGEPPGDEDAMNKLFYIAATAAGKYRYLSYARFKPGGIALEPSSLVTELITEHQVEVETLPPDPQAAMEFGMLQFSEKLPAIEKAGEDFIGPILEKFVMNLTALNNYLKCPLEFYFRNIVRIPAGKSEAREFGSAVHFAIQRLFEKMKDDPNEIFPSKAEMLRDFDWYMRGHRENFTLESFNRRLLYGEKILGNYYDRYVNTWSHIVAIELNIRNVVVRGVPIKGKLDKLEFNGSQVNVVDYKSGDFEKATESLLPPSEAVPNGGNYWRQAVFYKILVDHYAGKNWRVTSAEFDFIEPAANNQYQKYKVAIRPQDVETVTQQIVQVWKKIRNREFYTGCGRGKCYWCRFVKESGMRYEL